MTKRSKAARDYADMHPFCEACWHGQTMDVHHILTKGSGGPDEEWNFLALCRLCHNEIHNQGRATFAAHSHGLHGKISEACDRMGRLL
jgi:5-methylcytosine-specific restriction endonuclease McrA